jgi:site-specific recombinase XerD
MAVAIQDFFGHIETFFHYRKSIYETSAQTIRTNRIDLKLFKDFVESRDYSVIDGPAVMDFQYFLKEERNNTGGSINRKVFTLRRYAQHLRLVDVEAADTLPFDSILKIRRGYKNRPQALTKNQVQRLFAAIDRSTVLGIRDYAVYALMYLTGLRVGEVHRLDLKSIDFDQQTLSVTGKGNKIRVLHLHDELFQILTEYLTVRSGFHNHAVSTALFVSKKGNRLAIRTMEDNFKKIVARADLGASFPVVCHTLRHTFASHLNDEGEDILVIQSLMGHATPKSTEPYIHPSQETIRKAMEKLPAVIFIKELIEKGILNLRFQGTRPKRE